MKMDAISLIGQLGLDPKYEKCFKETGDGNIVFKNRSGEIKTISDGRDVMVCITSPVGDADCLLYDGEAFSSPDLMPMPMADFVELAGYVLEDAYAYLAED